MAALAKTSALTLWRSRTCLGRRCHAVVHAQGIVKATTRGWIDCIADPKAGGAAVKTREPLANQEIKTERLQLVPVPGTVPPRADVFRVSTASLPPGLAPAPRPD